MEIIDIILVLFAYIVGSIPTGFIIAKRFGNIDIKKVGSGNIGATNLTRVMGKKYGALTLLGDGSKALLYMLILNRFLLIDKAEHSMHHNMMLLCAAALFLLLGNCYSVFLGFKGGKGGVTTYGVFLALDPISSIVSILSYVVVGKIFKISAAGTLSSVIVLPCMIYFTYSKTRFMPYMVILACIFAAIVWIRHTKNIKEIFLRYRRKGK